MTHKCGIAGISGMSLWIFGVYMYVYIYMCVYVFSRKLVICQPYEAQRAISR